MATADDRKPGVCETDKENRLLRTHTCLVASSQLSTSSSSVGAMKEGPLLRVASTFLAKARDSIQVVTCSPSLLEPVRQRLPMSESERKERMWTRSSWGSCSRPVAVARA